MARAAIPGQAKTRLIPELSPAEAASLYQAMLVDRCYQVARLEAIEPAIALASPHGNDPAAHPYLPGDFRVLEASGHGFGADISAAARYFLDRESPVIIVDSDSPTLPLRYLEEALARIRAGDVDVVLGPAEDGGYYLIGLRRSAPQLFDDIPWSTSSVLEVTRSRAEAAGLSVHLLPTWWDVDGPTDVARLRGDLLEGWWPAHTADWLRRHYALAPGPATAPPEERWSAPWRRLSGRAVYRSPHLSLREDQVRMPDGNTTLYSVIDTGECVGVLPFVDRDTLLMVRQFRYVAGQVMLEMPTGGVHRGEPIEDAARRELAEEAGVAAGRLEYLGRYHTSKSVMHETAHLYAGYDLEPTRVATSDDTEFIAVEEVGFERALELVDRGEILDSMTIMALLHEVRRRGR